MSETPKKDQGLNFRLPGHLYLHLIGEEKVPRAIIVACKNQTEGSCEANFVMWNSKREKHSFFSIGIITTLQTSRRHYYLTTGSLICCDMFRQCLEKWNRLFYDCHTDPNTRNLSKEIIQIN